MHTTRTATTASISTSSSTSTSTSIHPVARRRGCSHAVAALALALLPAWAAASAGFNDVMDGEFQAVRLQQHALNIFLVPMLDDAAPPRWAKSLSAMRCNAGSRVSVDGKPLQPGALVPARSFTMHWKLVDCRPLGHTESFDGEVTLTVYHEDGGYSATVAPVALRVRTLDSSAVWSKTFATVMP